MSRKSILVTTFSLFVLTSIAMSLIDSYMQNDITPFGIFSFEFIQTTEAANQALQAWGEIGIAATGISLGLDFLYIPLYSTLIFILLKITAEKVTSIQGQFGDFLSKTAYFSIIAGIFDMVENFGLIQILLGSQNPLWPGIAFYFASAKFVILGLSLLNLLIGFIYLKLKA